MAKRSIKKGEEITINYGIHHHNIPKQNRQQLLLDKYKFECACEACENDYPTIQNCNSKIEIFPRIKEPVSITAPKTLVK